MPREWNTPVRECWNAPIHQINDGVSNTAVSAKLKFKF